MEVSIVMGLRPVTIQLLEYPHDYGNLWYPPPKPTFLWFLLVFAVNYAHFELIFLVAVLGHVLVALWGVPYIYINICIYIYI